MTLRLSQVHAQLSRILRPAFLYLELQRLTRYLAPQNAWKQKWWKHKKIYQEVNGRIEQTLLEHSTKYHTFARRLAHRRRSKKSLYYLVWASKLYKDYLQYFSKSESAYEQRFFYAETLRTRATVALKTKGKWTDKIQNRFLEAARHYHQVSLARKKTYLRQAILGEILCYEAISLIVMRYFQVSQKIRNHYLRWLTHSINRKTLPWDQKLPSLNIQTNIRRRSWKRTTHGSLERKLFRAYKRYFRFAQSKDERLQSYFKMAMLHHFHGQYQKAIQRFSALLSNFPRHTLARHSAIQILHTYGVLRDFKKVEGQARRFLRNRGLLRSRRFKKAAHLLLYRSAYRWLLQKKDRITPLLSAQHFMQYEKEFGKQGVWVKQGFHSSPRAPYALVLAFKYFSKVGNSKNAWLAKRRLKQIYPKYTIHSKP